MSTNKGRSATRYENFQDDEFDEDFDNLSTYNSTTAGINGSVGVPMADIALPGSRRLSEGYSNLNPAPTSTSSAITQNAYFQPKRIRLRPVESEREYYLKRLNLDLHRNLALAQIIASIFIIFSQVAIYVISTRETYRVLDKYQLGLWLPAIFLTAALLTSMTIKGPSGVMIGCSMGFQIASIVGGIVLLYYSTVSLFNQGMSSYSWEGTQSVYNHEVPRRIFYSIIIIAAMVELMAAIMTSVQYCKVTCCGKTNDHDDLMFDVETVAP